MVNDHLDYSRQKLQAHEDTYLRIEGEKNIYRRKIRRRSLDTHVAQWYIKKNRVHGEEGGGGGGGGRKKVETKRHRNVSSRSSGVLIIAGALQLLLLSRYFTEGTHVRAYNLQKPLIMG